MGEELALRREVRANLPLQYCSCYAAAALHGRHPRSCTDSAGATSACAGKHQSAPAAASGARFWLRAQASRRPPGHLCAGPSCARERRAPWHVQHTMVLRLCMPHGVSLRQHPNDHSAAAGGQALLAKRVTTHRSALKSASAVLCHVLTAAHMAARESARRSVAGRYTCKIRFAQHSCFMVSFSQTHAASVQHYTFWRKDNTIRARFQARRRRSCCDVGSGALVAELATAGLLTARACLTCHTHAKLKQITTHACEQTCRHAWRAPRTLRQHTMPGACCRQAAPQLPACA